MNNIVYCSNYRIKKQFSYFNQAKCHQVTPHSLGTSDLNKLYAAEFFMRSWY